MRKIWAAARASVDEPNGDYGEDLIIQTEHNQVVDPSRIFVQVKTLGDTVKGRKVFAGSPDHLKYRISTAHLIRWKQMQDLVVVVLWDRDSDSGWYSVPTDDFAFHELMDHDRRTVNIEFPVNQIFDRDAALMLASRSRYDNAARLVETLDGRLNYYSGLKSEDAVVIHQKAGLERLLVAIAAGINLGLFVAGAEKGSYELTPKFNVALHREVDAAPPGNFIDRFGHALTVVIFSSAGRAGLNEALGNAIFEVIVSKFPVDIREKLKLSVTPGYGE